MSHSTPVEKRTPTGRLDGSHSRGGGSLTKCLMFSLIVRSINYRIEGQSEPTTTE